MNFEIEEWLHKIITVKHENDVSCLLQHLKWSSEVEGFLRRLEINLKGHSDVNKIMATYPKVGQLLGRLCTFPGLLIIPSVYQALMQCVLCFYSTNPLDDVARRAKAWAVTQLRSSLSHVRNYFPTGVLDETGFTQQSFNQGSLSKVCEDIASTFRSDNSEEHAGVIDISTGSQQQLCELARLCLHLLHVPQYCHLLAETVRVMTSQRLPDPDVKDALAEISNCLSKGVVGVENAGVYQVCLTLWLNHLPSLEGVVLDAASVFIRSVPSPSQLHSHQISKYNYLVRACAEKIVIHSTVFTMLEELQRNCSKDVLSPFITQMHADIHSYNWIKNHKLTVTVPSQDPEES